VQYAVLCGPEDRSAVWAAGCLRAQGLPVRLVTTQELVYSASLVHTVGAEGTTASVRLGDGAVLGPDLRGTLNRMTWVPTAHLSGASSVDQQYAQQELQAVLTSLVHGLPGVVLGRPHGRGICGAWWRPVEWLVEAGRVGLRGHGYRSGAPEDLAAAVAGAGVGVVVVDGELVGPPGWTAPEDVVAGCLALAARHGSGLVGLTLLPDAGGWALATGTPLPDLEALGAPLVDALHRRLLATSRVAA
jgi:hypothetical protein